MTDKEKNQLVINIDSKTNDDDEQLEQLTLQLKEELRELDVDKVDFVGKGNVPAGAKGEDITG